jgi:hypothetical protein
MALSCGAGVLVVPVVTIETRGRAAKLKALEVEKSTLLARAEAAERVLVKGESKDQARMEALTDESRASRLKFLALTERLRQMDRLRDQVRETYTRVQACILVRSRGL